MKFTWERRFAICVLTAEFLYIHVNKVLYILIIIAVSYCLNYLSPQPNPTTVERVTVEVNLLLSQQNLIRQQTQWSWAASQTEQKWTVRNQKKRRAFKKGDGIVRVHLHRGIDRMEKSPVVLCRSWNCSSHWNSCTLWITIQIHNPGDSSNNKPVITTFRWKDCKSMR